MPTSETLPFMTAVGGHVLIHDGDTGAVLQPGWTGLCVDGRDTKKHWYIGRDAGEMSFTKLSATDAARARDEIAFRGLESCAAMPVRERG